MGRASFTYLFANMAVKVSHSRFQHCDAQFKASPLGGDLAAVGEEALHVCGGGGRRQELPHDGEQGGHLVLGTRTCPNHRIKIT